MCNQGMNLSNLSALVRHVQMFGLDSGQWVTVQLLDKDWKTFIDAGHVRESRMQLGFQYVRDAF